MRDIGRFKWFGGQNRKNDTVNDYGFIENLKGEDIYVHRTHIRFPFSYDRWLENKVISFDIEETNLKGKVARKCAVNLLLIEDEDDKEVLLQGFLSDNYLYSSPSAQRLFNLLTEDEIVDVLEKQIENEANYNDLHKLIPHNIEVILLSEKVANLRAKFPVRYLFHLYRNLEDFGTFIPEIVAGKGRASEEEWLSFCTSVKSKIRYGDSLYEAAPEQIKNDILRDVLTEKYRDWLDAIRAWEQIPQFTVEWKAADIYPNLNAKDQALAEKWSKDELSKDGKEAKPEYTNARMLSARAAEKVAQKFYQSLGYIVNDVSILQPVSDAVQSGDGSQDWKLFDLLITEGKIGIDVKNARTPVNNRVRYVEHCVPKFKQNRQNKEVIIAGVLSPYLKIESFAKVPSNTSSVKFLGETTFSRIQNLQNRFKRQYLELSLIVRKDNGEFVIPEWTFEYPEKFYESRNQERDRLKSILGQQQPECNEFQLLGLNPFPVYLANGIDLPTIWEHTLDEWQLKFYKRLRPAGEKIISMPILFLAVMTHFLEMLMRNENLDEHSYQPIGYDKMLFFKNSQCDPRKMPLGIYDPLEIIDSLIRTLNIIWHHRDGVNLSNFESFKLNGLGLLAGKMPHQNSYQTILAYCGGFVNGKGKCGNRPLIIGCHKTCDSCGNLICNKCGFCKGKCLECVPRMEDVSREKSESPGYSDDDCLATSLSIESYWNDEIDEIYDDKIPF